MLYLGLEVPPSLQSKELVHYPIIKVVARQASDPAIQPLFANFKAYTHLIFTSRQAVSIFFEFAALFKITSEEIQSKEMICVGQRTSAKLQEYHQRPSFVAEEETAEGIIDVLKPMDFKNAYIFLPQSSLARPVIANWLKKQHVAYACCAIYDTLPNLPHQLPDLALFHEIIFTSPSTIDAFLIAFSSLPLDKKLTSIGPITKRHLLSKIQVSNNVKMQL